jgi:phosphopantothenoylcysteine decarboxylase
VLLGLSGSVACVKAAQLVEALSAFADVRVVATPAALRFLADATSSPGVLAGAPLYTDAAEWAAWRSIGDPVLHIALRRWADALLIAPLSANSLAKVAAGLCDNLLTCVVRAWDFSKPLLVAPAMNTAMWASPFTARHLAALADLGVQTLPPISKRCVALVAHLCAVSRVCATSLRCV